MFGMTSRKKKDEEFMKLLGDRTSILYRIAFSYFRDEGKASDAVQDSVLIAYKSLPSLKDNEKFNSWITAILINRCREIMRRDNKIKFQNYEETVIDISSFYEKREDNSFSRLEDRMYVLSFIEKLDEKYSEVIRLKYLGDYTIADIALVLHVPEGTVKSRLNTGIKQLRSLMEVEKNAL